MEYIISTFLGWVASKLQGEKGKALGKRARFLLALLSSMVAGFIATFWQILVDQTYDPNMLLANIGVAFAASQARYNVFFKDKI